MQFFRALQSRDYRRFVSGQAISLIGDWMTMTTTGWLAYNLTKDPFTLGLVIFAQQIPLLFFSPVVGALGDRVNRRKLFCYLQGGCILHTSTLAILTLTGVITAPLLIGLALFRGLVNAAEFPTRQTLMVDLVGDKSVLPSAIALNSTLFNVARLIGPTFAGLAINQIGPGWCYALDAVSSIPVILLMMSIRDGGAGIVSKVKIGPLRSLREGVSYAANDFRLRAPLILVGVISLSGFAGVVLAPLIAETFLDGGAQTLGLLHTCVGIGALASAVFLGSRASHLGLERWVRRGALAVVCGQVLVAVSTIHALTFIGMGVCGMGTVMVFAGSNTVIQSYVANEKRGRVMGLFAMGQSMYPIGGLIIGALAATALGPRITMLLTALICLGGAVWFRVNAVTPMEKLAAESEPEPPVDPRATDPI